MKTLNTLVIGTIMVIACMTSCYGQKKLDSSLLNANPQEINEPQSEAIWMGLLKTCANTKAMQEELSSACMAVFEAGWRGQKWKPQNVAEAYWTYIKGDKSLEEANGNEFTLRKARASLDKKTDQALEAINSYGLSKTHYYLKRQLDPNSYDFDKAIYPIVLEGSRPSPSITLKGRMGGGYFFPSKDAVERGFKVEIPLPEDKASNLFGSQSRLDVIIDVQFEEFIEIGDPTRTYAGAIVKQIDVYHGKTGDLLFSHTL